MMHGLTQHMVRANGIRMNVWSGGHGAPLVLLHGYPQSAIMWRKVAPLLLNQHGIVCPDLRGYGDSDKPRDGYDKRTMACDIHELMTGLGHRTYAVVGHDRGARVAHRLALDYPDEVTRLVVLDIVPTLTVFQRTDAALAAAYWHWFFFQVPDLPEIMIGNSAEPLLRHLLRTLSWHAGAIEEAAIQEYLRQLRLPGTIRAGLEDYRAAATVDCADDGRDLEKKVRCPVFAIWGEFGKMHALFDVLATWRDRAVDVSGKTLPCGHFIPEELPDQLVSELQRFLVQRG